MKKLVTILLTLILCLTSFSAIGCISPSNNGPKNISFYAPDGAPALAIAKFINDNENFGLDGVIDYKIVSANDIGGVMSQGKGDFIIMPVNAASKLYKAKTSSPYVMTAVITHGNLYLMSSDGTNSLEQLKGKVVGVIGQGLVPDLTFKAILSDKGLIEDVVVGDTATDGKITLRYFQSAQDMIPLLKQGVLSVGLLPEPAATNLTKKANNREWTRTDIQNLYDSEQKAYPQAVLMVRKSIYDAQKTQINGMAEYFNTNAQWIKENTESAIKAVNSKLGEGITPSLNAETISATVIENCKIYFKSASISKDYVKTYLNKIISVSAQSAVSVTDDFFAN